MASLGFVRQSIEDTLQEVPAEKVINAIPFYTRLWKEPYGGGNLTSEVLGMDGASSFYFGKRYGCVLGFGSRTECSDAGW